MGGQWVEKVLKFSTEYNGWPASNVIGKQNTYPKYGDIQTCWAPSQSTGSQEFLELQFKNKVVPTKIEIYETFHPGSLVKISAKNEDGKWVALWKGKRKNEEEKSRIFKPKLKECDFATNEIRLDIDQVGAISFYEIDAVRLFGDEDGSDDEEKGKKKKGDKKKYIFHLADVSSKIYANLFNNKLYSDVTLKFEGNGNTVHCHKLILNGASGFYAKLFSEDEKLSEILIDKSEDEKLFMQYLKFLYTGSYEYESDESFILFSILANKYQSEGVKDFKVPAKKYLDGVLSYVEKDLDKRKNLLDNLLENVNFKKIEKEDLLKSFKKKKWLKGNTTFLNIILSKDAESDASDSKESGSGSESESSSD